MLLNIVWQINLMQYIQCYVFIHRNLIINILDVDKRHLHLSSKNKRYVTLHSTNDPIYQLLSLTLSIIPTAPLWRDNPQWPVTIITGAIIICVLISVPTPGPASPSVNNPIQRPAQRTVSLMFANDNLSPGVGGNNQPLQHLMDNMLSKLHAVQHTGIILYLLICRPHYRSQR